MRDVILGSTEYFLFTTSSSEVPTTLSGTPVVSVYEENNLTQITSGVSLTVDYDGVTGLNEVSVVATSGNGYEAGKVYYLVITTGTVGGTSRVGIVVGEFSIENQWNETDVVSWNGSAVAIPSVAGVPEVDVTYLNGSAYPTGSAALVDDIWDEVLTGGTHNVAQSAGRRLRGIQDFQGYEDGSIWINTINGSAGTTDYENGTVENQVDTLSDANTLNTSLGFDRFHISPLSSITLAATQSGQVFTGSEWTLALGGQNIANTTIEGATVSGIGTGSGSNFRYCEIGTTTTAPGKFGWCGFTGTWTIGSAGNFYLHDCYSQVAGSSTPIFDLGAAVGATNLSIRRWSGGLTFNNVATGDVVSVDVVSGGTITVNGTGGSVYIRGICDVTDGSGGSVTIVETSALNKTDISFRIWDEVLTGGTHNITDSSGKRLRNILEWGSYEGGAIFIDTVDGLAGTTDYEHGTILNPVNNIADANTLSASLNISRFELAPASSITFTASQVDQIFRGRGWLLSLGGQDISSSEFKGAQIVSGTGTTATGEAHFIDCELGTITIGQSHFIDCGLTGTVTISAAASYTFDNCYSKGTTAIIDIGAAIGSTELNMPMWSGYIEIQNLGQSGTDTVRLHGGGEVTLNANCIGGDLHLYGDFELIDNSGGAVTITYDDNTTSISSILTDTGTTIPAQITALNNISTTEVNAEMLDVLVTDTFAELAAVPSATSSLKDKLTWIFMLARNQLEQTSTTATVRADNTTTAVATSAISDDGSIATRGEFS